VTLERRTPLRRDTEAARAFADKRAPLARNRAPLARTGPPAPRSAKRIAEDPERARVRRIVIARDGERCAGAAVVPSIRCQGPLDLDEICQRGVRPGGHLDPANCQLLCRFGHHRWKTENARLAVAVGLRRWSWQ
jgi:hypothetical protein